MKLAVLLLLAAVPQYRQAVPGYRYQFPRDHFEHPDFRTEWWYYTGNVHAANGHRYGFELVFFREGEHEGSRDNPSAWRIDDLYLAHLALTDIDGRRFLTRERLNRAGPGIAGASFAQARVWNGNWQARWDLATSEQTLTAVAEGVRLSLRLTPRKPPVIHGVERRQPEGGGRGQGIVLRLVPAAGGFREYQRRRGDGRGMDGPRVVYPPAGSQPAGLGLVQCATGKRQRADAVPTAQYRRRDRSVFVGHLHRGRRTRPASVARGFRSSSRWTTGRVRRPVRATRCAGRSRCPPCTSHSNAVRPFRSRNSCRNRKAARCTGKDAVTYTGSARGVGYLEMTGYDKAVKL